MAAGPSVVTMIVVLICTAGLVVLWIMVARQPRAGAARCGKCGYAVEGLETMSCPECGADFRKVGIQSARARLMPPVAFLIGWTVLLPLPAVVISVLAGEQVPRRIVRSTTIYVQPTSGSFPLVALHVEVDSDAASFGGVGGTSTSTRSTANSATAVLKFPPQAATDEVVGAQVLLIGTTGAITSVAPGTPAGGPAFALPTSEHAPIDEEALARWLAARSTGAQATDPDVLALDAADLAGLARAIISGAGTYTSTRMIAPGSATAAGRARLPLWWTVSVVAFWLLVYAGGVVLFLLVRRRRLAPWSE